MRLVWMEKTRPYGVGSLAACAAVVVLIVGCTPPGNPAPQFPGLYDVTRGAAQLKISWVAGQTEGETTQESHGGELEPLDANDVPALFQPLVEAWNDAIGDFNAGLDDIFPDQVRITHPQTWNVRIADPNDPNEGFQGLNGPDGFLAVALGIPTPAQGPAIPSIGASTVTGVYDGVDTIVGEWAVSITMGGSGPQGGLLLSIAIVIPYEAVRIPE